MHPALPWHPSLTRPRLALAKSSRILPLTLVMLTCVGFALRLPLLDAFPLREDEAIYGFWARMAFVDPYFLHTWPDKPPLFIWLLSGAFALWGAGEASARLVSIFASTVMIPVVALGAWRLWHSSAAAMLAGLLIALNPFALSFAPTAYTDSVLVLLGTGALVGALGGPHQSENQRQSRIRGLGVGLLLGAACMTKQQGLFYAPLVLALLMVSPVAHARARVQWGWALLGVALITLPILWWDSQRWAVAPSPWALAQQTYAPLTFVPPQDWPGRGQAWANLLWYLGGSVAVCAMLVAALVAASAIAFGSWLKSSDLRGDHVAHEVVCGETSLPFSADANSAERFFATLRMTLFKRFRHGAMCEGGLHAPLPLVLGWGFCFLLLHMVTTIQVWDRYLLPLAPWLALVASGPLAMLLHRPVVGWLRGLLCLLLVVGIVELVSPALAAGRGQMPIGGDHGDYAGLTEAIAWVQAQCDEAANKGCPAILYHQALGWHFRFYLFDELQAESQQAKSQQAEGKTPRFELRWFPSAAYLADNAAKSPYPPKYLIVPDWATPRDLALHLAMRGLKLESRARAGRFAVVEIIQPPRPACDWCRSSPPSFGSKPLVLPVAPQMSTP